MPPGALLLYSHRRNLRGLRYATGPHAAGNMHTKAQVSHRFVRTPVLFCGSLSHKNQLPSGEGSAGISHQSRLHAFLCICARVCGGEVLGPPPSPPPASQHTLFLSFTALFLPFQGR